MTDLTEVRLLVAGEWQDGAQKADVLDKYLLKPYARAHIASQEQVRAAVAELRRRGMQVNHKRVRRLMREDNLLAIRSRRYVITTDSRHQLDVYMNLARRMKLSGINQLWVADLTWALNVICSP